MQTVTDFIYFLVLQNHRRWWLQPLKTQTPWEKSNDKPSQCVKKQRHDFADKGPYSQSYGFPVVMYGCETWTIKKAEHQRIDAFELWCWRRLLRVPCIARRSNQPILKEISPEYSEKAMATHSSTLAWKIPWMEEPGRLQSMGSRKVGHDFTFTFHFHALEKEMATHSSGLAWRIPGMGEPGGLPSVGLHRVGHDWSDLVAAAALD